MNNQNKTVIEENVEPSHTEEKTPCDPKQIKCIVEALLFASNEPLSLKKLLEVISEKHLIEKTELQELIEELKNEYEERPRGFQLDEIAKGYMLRSKKEYGHYLEALLLSRRKDRLSPAATEVLAIIAFRQPLTKSQVDEIRGVDSSGVLHNLQERGLVHQAGNLEAPGRPSLFGTTQEFLIHFGLKDLNDLKQLSERDLSN